MDKYRRLSFDVIYSKGTEQENETCERYRNLLREVGASDDAIKQTNNELIEFAKTFVLTIPIHLRD